MTVLAIIGLVLGLVVLLVVVKLLNDTLTPLRQILAEVQGANTAPLLKRGVPGTEQLDQTRRLAESVPDLAVRYLQKLGLSANTDTPARLTAAAPAAPAPAPAPPPPPPAPVPAGAEQPAVGAPAGGSAWEPPAWHRHRS